MFPKNKIEDIDPAEFHISGFFEVKGVSPVLITCSHSQAPKADNNTGEIAFRVATLTNSYGLISTISREQIDANRKEGRILEYRKKIAEVIKAKNIHYLFDIHGMKNTDYDIDIGTANGKTATDGFVNSIIQTFLSFGLDAKKDFKYSGLSNDLLMTNSNSPELQAVQIEISEENRRLGSCLIVEGLCMIVYNILHRWNGR